MTIFSDFTDGGNPASTDYVVGYATGGGGGSDRRWQIGSLFAAQTSLVVAGAGNCAIELGRTDGNASTPVLDFHSGATAVDFDARLIASGGTGSSGGGALAFTGAGGFNPSANDGATIGVGGTAWSDLFLASGGIINFANGDLQLTHAGSGQLSAIMSNAAGVVLNLQNNDAGTVGAFLDFFHNSASPANADIIAAVRGFGMSSTAVKRQYSSINTVITDTTNTSEDAQLDFYAMTAGSLSTVGARLLSSNLTVGPGTGIPAGGNLGLAFKGTSTANFGVFFGSGAPSINAQAGSLYLRSDGSSTSTRSYISQGGGVWTNLVTAA